MNATNPLQNQAPASTRFWRISPHLLALLAFPWQIGMKSLFYFQAPAHLHYLVFDNLAAAIAFCTLLSLPALIAMPLCFIILARTRATIRGTQITLLLLSLVLSFSSIACALCDILLAPANPHQPGYWP
jgi:hypothetical protein